MNRTRTEYISTKSLGASRLSDYVSLIKPRLTSVVVFTAVASFVVAAQLAVNGIDILLLAIGGFGVAGASNTLNQALEKDFDILMKRTKNRPVAAGRLTMSNAVMFAGFLCLLGITALAVFNVLTAFLGMLAFITYAFVYTPLKRYSSAAIFVGAVAGAMPMVIGVVAFTGSFTWLALSLFVIQFAWQYPHFWAIGYLGFEDYTKAGFRFIPTEDGAISRSLGMSSLFYSCLVTLVSILMTIYGLVGLPAGMVMILLGSMYVRYAYIFHRKFDERSARSLMFTSLLYIPLVLIILIIDKI